jgi:hypothetical protein
MKRLLEIGFCRAGEWVLKDGKLKDELEAGLPNSPALYAFVTGQTVCYLGKTARSLAARMQNYRNSDSSQSANQRVAGEIGRCLERKSAVEIYAFFDPGLLHYGAFPINLPAALEDGLIAGLNPAWNDQKTLKA